MSNPGPEHPYARAWRTRNLQEWLNELDDDIQLCSPLLSRPFEGKADAERLFSALFAAVAHLDITDVAVTGRTSMVTWSARTTAGPFDGVDVIHAGDNGSIRRIDVYIRPLTGIARFTRAVTPALMHQEPPIRRGAARVASTGMLPLFVLVNAAATRLTRHR